MGIDLLDMVFRLEREFGLRVNREDDLFQRGDDMTAGEVQFIVGVQLLEQGKALPDDFWPRVQRVIAKTLEIPEHQIHPTSRLFDDLGMR